MDDNKKWNIEKTIYDIKDIVNKVEEFKESKDSLPPFIFPTSPLYILATEPKPIEECDNIKEGLTGYTELDLQWKRERYARKAERFEAEEDAFEAKKAKLKIRFEKEEEKRILFDIKMQNKKEAMPVIYVKEKFIGELNYPLYNAELHLFYKNEKFVTSAVLNPKVINDANHLVNLVNYTKRKLEKPIIRLELWLLQEKILKT